MAAIYLSVVLGGGFTLAAQGTVLVATGLLWLFWPPASWPARPVIWLLAALALLPLGALLPQSFFSTPPWRESLHALGIANTSLVTPQPWVTLQWWLLWAAGVSLCAWCCSQNWDAHHRDSLARLYVAGLAIVAVAAILGHATRLLWSAGTGPYPTAEEWGVAAAMGAIVGLALAHRCLGHGWRRGMVVWGTAAALLAATVAFNGARSGLAVLVAGCLAYGAFYHLLRRRYKWASVAGAMLACALAFFFLFAAPEASPETQRQSQPLELRVRGAMASIPRTTLVGVGLGNLEYIAPMRRGAGAGTSFRPPNSLLWIVGEGGWLLALAAATSLGAVVAAGQQRESGGGKTLRSASMACAVAVAAISFLGTSAHRTGVIFPALFVLSLAFPAADGAPVRGFGRSFARGGGCLLVLLGLLWGATYFGVAFLPALQGTSADEEAAALALRSGNYTSAIAGLQRVTAHAPLNASARSELARSFLQAGRPDDAWREFRIAAELLPEDVASLRAEGSAWAPTDSGRAAYAWAEALQRSDHAARAGLYAELLGAATERAALLTILRRLYPDDPEFELVRIRAAGANGPAMLPRLLALTGQLATAPDYLVEPTMRYMLEHGRSADLARVAAESPRLRALGWRALADLAASENRLGEATRLHLQHGIPPNLPPPPVGSDLATIERAASMAPGDLATSLAYYHALAAARRKDRAYAQLQRIMELPGAPAYVWYLAANDAQELGRDNEAWEYVRAYEERSQAAEPKNARRRGDVPAAR